MKTLTIPLPTTRAWHAMVLLAAWLMMLPWAATADDAGPQFAEMAGGTDALADRVVLVTGSTDGMGRELAHALGALGAHVIVHGRNRERGEAVVAAIEDQGRGSAEFIAADFASLDAVQAFADEVRSRHDRLHLLVNNAGIWRSGDDDGPRQESEDGHELVFAVNYLSHYLLTHELATLLEAGAPSRVVNVASRAQTPIDFEDPMLERDFSEGRAYAQSKLAQILFTIDLAPEFEDRGITVNSLHPASLMDTTMVRQAGVSPRATVDEGLTATMQLAVSPDLEGRTGLYFEGLDEARADDQAYDAEARRKLRALSDRLTGRAD